MNGNLSDQALVHILNAPAPASIDDVIRVMQSIDTALPSNDGLKWFNLLYLSVTRSIRNSPPPYGWANTTWITRLDVVFANLYFTAIANVLHPPTTIPSAWQALFEARYRGGIDRIQFALAGMNAHINHDLPLALVQTNSALHLTPALHSREHSDFEDVNTILASVMPEALHFLATGLIGEIAQDAGKIGRLLAMWDVRIARDLAWANADLLQALGVSERKSVIEILNKLTGVASRALLLPLQ